MSEFTIPWVAHLSEAAHGIAYDGPQASQDSAIFIKEGLPPDIERSLRRTT